MQKVVRPETGAGQSDSKNRRTLRGRSHCPRGQFPSDYWKVCLWELCLHPRLGHRNGAVILDVYVLEYGTASKPCGLKKAEVCSVVATFNAIANYVNWRYTRPRSKWGKNILPTPLIIQTENWAVRWQFKKAIPRQNTEALTRLVQDWNGRLSCCGKKKQMF